MITDEAYERKTALLQRYAQEFKMIVVLANYSGATGGELSAGKSAIWSGDGMVAGASDSEERLVIARDPFSAAFELFNRLSIHSIAAFELCIVAKSFDILLKPCDPNRFGSGDNSPHIPRNSALPNIDMPFGLNTSMSLRTIFTRSPYLCSVYGTMP